MQMFVGLGNPGPKYARTRHNIGFMAVDRIAQDHGFGPFRAKFQGEIAEGRLGGEKVILLKPMTFMNLSGQSVGEAMRFYKMAPADITVFHDEIDLAPGKVRLKTGGGHAGHNGLRSLHQHVGPDYARVRLGIGHPGRKEAVPGYVLHDFAKVDEDWLDDLLRGIGEGAPRLADGDGPGFQNAVARRMAPARPAKQQRATEAGPARAGEAEAGDKAAPVREGGEAPDPEEDGRSPLRRLVDRFR